MAITYKWKHTHIYTPGEPKRIHHQKPFNVKRVKIFSSNEKKNFFFSVDFYKANDFPSSNCVCVCVLPFRPYDMTIGVYIRLFTTQWRRILRVEGACFFKYIFFFPFVVVLHVLLDKTLGKVLKVRLYAISDCV